MSSRHTLVRLALAALAALSLGPLRGAEGPFDPAMDVGSLCSTEGPRTGDARHAIQGTPSP